MTNAPPNIPGFAVTPFQGVSGASVNLAANGASQAVRVLPDAFENANVKLRQVRVANLSLTDDVYIAWGDAAVTVDTTTGMAIPHGDVEIITIGSATHIAAITGGAVATLNFTPGGGV